MLLSQRELRRERADAMLEGGRETRPMFHTYIIASTGTPVDIDRASFLMDAEIWRRTLADLQQAAPDE
jgi:hypothetical protein